MHKSYRTFVLWLLWGSAATVIYLGLYLDTDILTFLEQDKSKITWIITLLFILGVITSFILTVIITGEYNEAVSQEELAQKDGLMGLQASRRKKKAVNRFFDALRVVAASNEKPDIDALVSMELAAYWRLSHGVEVLGNLLITLGLIGTVMGLTLTLTGLTTSLDALGTDQDLLLQGLRTAMGGMGTAFYTTLLGAVLGGVLLRIFALITENGISSLHDYIMKTCMVFLTADFKPTMERDIRFLNAELEALSKKVEGIQGVFRDSTNAINEFHDSVKAVYKLSGDDDNVQSLRETLKMQRYYRALLRQEIHLMNKLNKSWWMRFKEFLPTKHND